MFVYQEPLNKMFWHIFERDIRSLKNLIFNVPARRIIFIFFILVLCGVFAGIFIAFNEFFKYLVQIPEAGNLLLRYILANSMAFVWILMIGSYALNTVILNFFDKSQIFLFTTPIPVSKIYLFNLIKGYLWGLWPLGLVAIPIFLAHHLQFQTSWVSLLITVISIIPFSILSMSIGSVMIHFFIQLNFLKKRAALYTLLLAIIAVIPSLYHLLTSEYLVNFSFSIDIDINSLRQAINQLPVLRPYWPSAWVANIAIENHILQNAVYLGIFSMIGLIGAFCFGVKAYYPIWLTLRERNFTAGRNSAKQNISIRRLWQFSIIGSIAIRHMTYFWRSKRETVNSMFLIILALFYIYALFEYPSHKIEQGGYYHHFILLSFIASNYITIIFCMKFIFPITQLNLKDYLLFCAPIPVQSIYRGLLIFSTGLVFCFSFFIMLPTLIHSHDIHLKLCLLITHVFLSITLSGLCLALGTMVANFKYDMDEDVASTNGGIIATIISLIVTLIYTGIYHMLLKAYAWEKWIMLMVLLMVITMTTGIVASKCGTYYLKAKFID